MALSPRTKMTLGVGSAVLLAGVSGLAWWLWRHHRGREPLVGRLRRTRAALVALGLLVIALGAIWRLVIAFNPVPVCSTPGSREGPSSHVTIVYALIAGLCNALNVTA
jgi:membrane-associated phospholipid phosphatase